MKILFDISVIVEAQISGSSRTGIYVVASEVLRELRRRKNIVVDAYVRSELETIAFDALKNDDALNGIYCVNIPIKRDVPNSFFVWLERHGVTPDMRIGFFRQCMWLPYRCVRKCLLWIHNWMVSKIHAEDFPAKIGKYDYYISPMKYADEVVGESGVRQCYIIHDMIPLLFPEYFQGADRDGTKWVKELATGFSSKDVAFCVSQSTRNDFIRCSLAANEKNTLVMPLASNRKIRDCKTGDCKIEVLSKYGLKDGKYFLSVCSIEPRKNLRMVIKGFMEFCRDNQDVKLVIVGAQWRSYAAEWRSIMEDIDSVRERIVLTGYVKDEELPTLYSSAMAFMYLSLYEGFGLPPLEAMQCGCPVIVSNSSSLPEVVGDAGLLVDPNDLSRLVAVMKQIASDRLFRENLRKMGVMQAASFSWSRSVDIVVGRLSLALGRS